MVVNTGPDTITTAFVLLSLIRPVHSSFPYFIVKKQDRSTSYVPAKLSAAIAPAVLVLVCADPRTMMVYLTTRRPGDREKLFQASVASAVEQMMLVAASMGFGTVWVSVREEIEPDLRELFSVPQPIRLLWVVPIGRARFWPGAKPRRKISDFTHYESYEPNKMRDQSWIKAWPKG